MDRISILFLAADPFRGRKLDLEDECREIREKLRGCPLPVCLTPRWAVRPDDLLQALDEETPDIVHFSTRGEPSGRGGILLHSGDPVSPARRVGALLLRELFEICGDGIRIVVFNACFSLPQARAVAEVIDCVVGVPNTISDPVASLWAAAFYRAIGFGKSVLNAYEQGRLAISLGGYSPDDSHMPELWPRKGISPDAVFLSDTERQPPSGIAVRGSDDWPKIVSPTRKKGAAFDIQAGRDYLSTVLSGLVNHESPKPLTVVIIDIDELTLINKHYGAAVGDQVLSLTANSIAAGAGPNGVTGRCGEDTFHVILPSGAHAAKHAVRRIRQRLKSFKWAHIAAGLTVTCSFGIAEHREQEVPLDTVIRSLFGMLEAKSQGKGRSHLGPEHLPRSASRHIASYIS